MMQFDTDTVIEIMILAAPLYMPFLCCFFGEYLLMRKSKRIYHYILFAVFGILFLVNLIDFYGQPESFFRSFSLTLCLGSLGGVIGAGIMFILVKAVKFRRNRKYQS